LAIAAPKISGSASRAGRARRKSSAVHSGLSGSERYLFFFRFGAIAAYLSPVCFSQADDVHPAVSRRVDQHMHPGLDQPICLESQLAVFTSVVSDMKRLISAKIRSPLQRNAVNVDIARILRRVE
jgi:hypothetical protein